MWGNIYDFVIILKSVWEFEISFAVKLIINSSKVFLQIRKKTKKLKWHAHTIFTRSRMTRVLFHATLWDKPNSKNDPDGKLLLHLQVSSNCFGNTLFSK